MKFVSSPELRISPGTVWRKLDQEKDLVVTSNGHPIGVLTLSNEEVWKTSLRRFAPDGRNVRRSPCAGPRRRAL